MFYFLCHLQQIVLRMGKIKDGVFQIAAGGSAGFLEVCLMQPLDLVKTRFQVQSSVADQTRYKSLVDCFLRIYRQEGGLAFYKGIVPPIMAETPKRAVKFFTFEQYRSVFAESKSINPACGYSLAGLLCGVTEAMVVNPFEAVKVRLQVDRQASVLEQNTFAMARQLIKQGGLGTNGINRGLSATMWRNGIWNMIYFGFYHSTKSYVASSDSELKHNLPIRIGLSFTAGCLACIGNTPFDVAKSRIQASIQTRAKYRSCLQSIAVIYREEGLLALYRGLLPKIMRLGPGGAVLMIAYEHIFEFLKSNFD
ncbi:coatomer subunit beta [Trichinella spiralis]|nr:coatomer subunit beta [Trichinella spiralis]